MEEIGFGLIGAGVIGRVHARNVAARADARLRWIVDIDATRGGELAAAHGARFTASIDEMLADPAVRVVMIGSSTDVHEAHLLACVRAGKAILCEKPIADSLERARNCLDAVRAANAIAAIGFNRRFDAQHREVHDRVRAGEIGTVESVHIVSRASAAPPPAAAHRAGGMLREKGTHHYDLACWLVRSEPVEVYAAGGCLFDPGFAAYGDVDTAALTLRFASGALATFSFSRRTAYGCDESIEVFGSKGHAAVAAAEAAFRVALPGRPGDRRRHPFRLVRALRADLRGATRCAGGERPRRRSRSNPRWSTACAHRPSPRPPSNHCSRGVPVAIANVWQE